MNTKCGVVGIYNKSSIAFDDFLNILNKIQHRGHESWGYSYYNKLILNDNQNYKTSNNDFDIINHKYLGLIKDTYSQFNTNLLIPSNYIIGHVRYSTSGNSKNMSNHNKLNEAQPFIGNNNVFGNYSLCHNGNIPINNEEKLKLKFDINSNYYNSTNSTNLSNLFNDFNDNKITDTQFINKLIEYELTDIESLLIKIINNIDRAYNFIILINNNIYAMKDRYNTRPICIGENESGYCIVSESCALYKYNFIREIEPGEIIKVNNLGIKTIYSSNNKIQSACLFEYIYFLHPTTTINDKYLSNMDIFNFRYNTGISLADKDLINKNINFDNFIVVGVPSTGIASGMGYANRLSIKYEQIIVKNENINRTFILENNEERDKKSKEKYILDDNFNFKNKKVLITDDSLVRGITIKNIIKKLWDKGVSEIHVRIASPAVYNPCYYGIDIPTKEELLINKFSENGIINYKEFAQYLNCSSISYIEVEDIKKILYYKFKNERYINKKQDDKKQDNKLVGFCSGCFNNNYGDYSNNEIFDW